MKNSKLNEIVGYPVWINDINFDDLFKYLKEENFNLKYTETHRKETTIKYYLVTHELLIGQAVFLVTKTPDYATRMLELIQFCGKYEIEKRLFYSNVKLDERFSY